MCTGFVIYMLISLYLYIINHNVSRVFKFANVCNNGYCHCSVYDLCYYLFKISFSNELQILSGGGGGGGGGVGSGRASKGS